MISSYRTYEEWKQSIADAIGVEVQCSYRTYEEWKQCQPPKTKQPGSPSSYRTYEEWKLLDDTRSSTWNLSSYRTYEEWKHAIVKCVEWSARVLTVPMRNGN